MLNAHITDDIVRFWAAEKSRDAVLACVACLCRRFPRLRELHLSTVRRGYGDDPSFPVKSVGTDLRAAYSACTDSHQHAGQTALHGLGEQRLRAAIDVIAAAAASSPHEAALHTLVWRADGPYARAGLHQAALWLAWLPAMSSLRSLDLSGAAYGLDTSLCTCNAILAVTCLATASLSIARSEWSARAQPRPLASRR